MVGNVPPSVGHLRVTARGIVGFADSDDEGTEPDATPMAGKVRFTPSN